MAKILAAVVLLLLTQLVEALEPPQNDSIVNAEVITGSSGFTRGTNILATPEFGETVIGTQPANATVWYQWTAPASGTITFKTLGSNFDTLLGAFAADDNFTEMASNDDDTGGLKTSSITFNAVAGVVYYIVVDGVKVDAKHHTQGQILLSWSDGTGPGTLVFGPTTTYLKEAGGTQTIPLYRLFGGVGSVTATVAYDTTGFTAAQGTDYTVVSTNASFGNGVFVSSVSVNVAPNALADGDKTIGAHISGTTGGAVIGSVAPIFAEAAATILNDDHSGNDDFANAVAISGATGNIAFSNQTATQDVLDPYYKDAGRPNHSIWFTWTAPQDGVVTFLGSQDSPVAAAGLYTGTNGALVADPLSQVGQGLPGDSVDRGYGSFNVTANTTYHLLVDDAFGAVTTTAGNLSWSMFQTGSFRFTSANVTAYENADYVDLIVERVGDTTKAEIVNFTAAAGTATAFDDFSPTIDPVTFAAGQTTAVAHVPIVADDIADAGETFTVTLVPANGYVPVAAPSTVTVTINNNDNFADAAPISGASGKIRGGLDDVTAEAGEPSPTGVANDGALSVWYTWTAPSSGPVSFYTPSFTDDTSDVPFSPTPLSVFTGATLTGLTRVATSTRETGNDDAFRANFIAQAGVTYHIAVGSQFFSLFELRWEVGSLLSFSAANYNVAEAAGTVSITVNRTGNLTQQEFATVKTSDGTATAEKDYGSHTELLIFNAGETSKTFTVNIINDTIHELDETFNLTIAPAVITGDTVGNGVIDPTLGTATVTITSDDVFAVQSGNFQSVLSLGPEPAHNGTVTTTVSADGKLTGKLVYGGVTYTLKGTLSAQGAVTLNIARKAPLAPLTLKIESTGGGQRFFYTLTDGAVTGTGNGDRQSFNGKDFLAPHFGTYTASITTDSGPEGHGVATASVGVNGAVKITGTLADGTPFSASGMLAVTPDDTAATSHAQIYVPLYKNGGYLRGEIKFDGFATGNDFTSTLTWLKPNLPTEKFYPAGFTLTAEMQGQRYFAPLPGTRAMPGLNGAGVVNLSLGGGGQTVESSDCYWLLNNLISTGGFLAPKVTLKVTPKTGLISGMVITGTLKPVKLPLKAIILQRTHSVDGMFLNAALKTSGYFEGQAN